MANVLARAALMVAVALGLVVTPAAAASAAVGGAPRHTVALVPGSASTDGALGLRGGGQRPGRHLPPQLSPDEQRALADRAEGRPTDAAAVNRAIAKLRQGQKYEGTRNKQKRAENHKGTGRNPGGAGHAASVGAVVGIGGTAWLLAKLASPACGPAAPICAAAF